MNYTMSRQLWTFGFTVLVVCNLLLVGGVVYLYQQKTEFHTPLAPLPKVAKTPLYSYAYDTMKKRAFETQEMSFDKPIDETSEYETRMFYFQVEGKKVSGLAHIPKTEGDHPVIVMVRGFVDPAIYKPGVGTMRVAQELAKKGYITLAPDFLGYGESEMPGILPLQDRFQTYPTVIQLFKNIKHLNISFQDAAMDTKADQEKIGIWAHSNGGQIALSVLEMTGAEYPTVLWAPVSKPFPYSVLYFTDEFEDDGRALRRVIYQFEEVYDIQRFSLTNYFDEIKAPLQLHQGGLDDAVPKRWSDQLYDKLKAKEKDIEYFTYPEADHNMQPDWSTATLRSISFFDEKLK